MLLSTIFPRWINRLPLLLLLLGGGGFCGVVGLVWYYGSPKYTDVGYRPIQPVPYSHKLHPGTLGMDCRYCHTGVEKSPYANIPASQICMNCHRVIKPDSPMILPVRASFENGLPIEWIRVHKLPDFAHFDHSAHVNKGVGCVSCHGRIDQMAVVSQAKPLSMSWCLECHRNPENFLRPKDQVTLMDDHPLDLAAGRALVKEYNVQPPENCSACHY
jgi:hypothetical protein